MKRTVALALRPTVDQRRKLKALQAAYADARNTIALTAFEQRTTNRVALHHRAYYTARSVFPQLGSQMICNAIASVARSLKAHRANVRPWQTLSFRADGSVHLDARTYRLLDDYVSVFTMTGREHVALRVGAFQRRYLERGVVREADLADTPAAEGESTLGIDLGENVAAATSSGKLYGGGKLRETRDRFLALRRRLQGNGSQSARQLLQRVSGRESRHVRPLGR